MPLLGGANHWPPHLSDGIAPARLSERSERSCLHDGFSVAEPPALVFKNGGYPEAPQKTFGNSDRNPTTAITGLRSGNQLALHRTCPLKQIRVHGMVGLFPNRVGTWTDCPALPGFSLIDLLVVPFRWVPLQSHKIWGCFHSKTNLGSLLLQLVAPRNEG